MKRDYRRSGRGRKRSSLAEQLRQLAMLTAIRAPATTGPSGNFNIALRGGNYQITPDYVVGAEANFGWASETAVSHGSAYPGNLLFGSPSLPFGASPNLVLPIGDLLLGFGQTLLNDRAVHCVSGPRPSSAAEQRAATDRPA